MSAYGIYLNALSPPEHTKTRKQALHPPAAKQVTPNSRTNWPPACVVCYSRKGTPLGCRGPTLFRQHWLFASGLGFTIGTQFSQHSWRREGTAPGARSSAVAKSDTPCTSLPHLTHGGAYIQHSRGCCAALPGA